MTALLIVGHGTRDAEGAEEFRRFTRRVERRAAQRADLAVDGVAGGFIELSPPPLKDAVDELVGADLRDVVAVPLILLAAGHAKGDIPAALARERHRHPGLRTNYARPLGVHPVILDLLRERLAASAGSNADAVLLVGRGTTDPDANADLYRAARLLWETTQQSGVEHVEPAFVSLARPSVDEGLARLRRLGARRVAVLPFFLFPGVLPDRITEQAEAAAAQHGMDVSVAGVIGDCDGLADLVLERYAEATGGKVSVNCDACVYRIAMPGFEHRVGAPQQPHDHPDDPAHGHGSHESGAHEHGAHEHSAHVHTAHREGAHAHPHTHSHDPAHAPGSGASAARSVQGRDSAETRHAGSPSVR